VDFLFFFYVETFLFIWEEILQTKEKCQPDFLATISSCADFFEQDNYRSELFSQQRSENSSLSRN
jgi:hypothetical protein